MMEIGIGTLAWSGVIVMLFCTSLGYYMAFWLSVHVVLFLTGVLAVLFYQGHVRSAQWKQNLGICFVMPQPSIGIPKLVEAMRAEKPACTVDKRMTGAVIIDEVLHEVMSYTYRDFIQTWYKKISDDREFEHAIRVTLQNVVIAFSDRAKEVDLIPYLTTHLVDDFASHIRLYRRALDKMNLHQLDSTKPPPDLESIFFDLECEMEKTICRDMICLSEESEMQYLQDVTKVLLFLLLPSDDFHNKPFRYITREIVISGVLLRCVNMFSDPDYINQFISWLTKDTMFTSESFLTILKTSDNLEELLATKEKVDLDIARQRSKDTGGDDDADIKQQLSSLKYVKSVCENSIDRLNKGIDDSDYMGRGNVTLAGQKLYSLPFDVVINNNIALEFFMDFMSNFGAKHYIYFYFTVEGYRVSAEQQIAATLLAESGERADLEMLRDAANSIFHQYLSEKASPRVKCDDALLKKIWHNIQDRDASDTVFDEIQARVYHMLQEDAQYFPAFRKSQLYIRLLAELDLLRDPGDEDECSSGETSKGVSPVASRDDLQLHGEVCSSGDVEKSSSTRSEYSISAHISNTGVCREHGKQYAVYLVSVTKQCLAATSTTWNVYRRYSDFYELHQIIQDKFEGISAGLVLPSKKAFNNMNKDFLERRKTGLNGYLQTLLNPGILNCHKGLSDLMYNFLENMVWEKSKITAKTRDTGINLKSVGNFVKSMPDNFVDGVTKVSGGIRSIPNNMLGGVGRLLNVKAAGGAPVGVIEQLELPDSQKVGASLINEEEENIPLRIMLLLMDEVFDLKNRNQWLRRRIVAILRQFIKTMFGDSINRKIVEHMEHLTSAEQIAEHLKTFRDNIWPNGTLAEAKPEREHNTQMRSRIVAKTKMLGTIDDELKSFLGSDTTRRGVIRIFNMFQHQKLNKRLVYVILEGMLETLFPDNKFQEVFHKIHSSSPRVEKLLATKCASFCATASSDVRQRKK